MTCPRSPQLTQERLEMSYSPSNDAPLRKNWSDRSQQTMRRARLSSSSRVGSPRQAAAISRACLDANFASCSVPSGHPLPQVRDHAVRCHLDVPLDCFSMVIPLMLAQLAQTLPGAPLREAPVPGIPHSASFLRTAAREHLKRPRLYLAAALPSQTLRYSPEPLLWTTNMIRTTPYLTARSGSLVSWSLVPQDHLPAIRKALATPHLKDMPKLWLVTEEEAFVFCRLLHSINSRLVRSARGPVWPCA
ncbi:hypothetical protein B0H21DRAFT_36146 [Amylocystis lapponica]|nr:hypothetical protein B0H21DRAFT_36146 [Amylocystis lapponica]